MLANLASAIDYEAASTLRASGVPVLEGTSSGLAAIGHVLRLALGPTPPAPGVDVKRQAKWRTRLANDRPLRPDEAFALLADYGIASAALRHVDSVDAAVAAAERSATPSS